MSKDSNQRTLITALILCFVASIFVSFSAVFLKEKQESNKALEKKKNILRAAGLISSNQIVTETEIEENFKR